MKENRRVLRERKTGSGRTFFRFHNKTRRSFSEMFTLRLEEWEGATPLQSEGRSLQTEDSRQKTLRGERTKTHQKKIQINIYNHGIETPFLHVVPKKSRNTEVQQHQNI